MRFSKTVHKVIKIPDKDFEDLDAHEIAKMILADSAISPNGNQYFDGCALDEFVHNRVFKRMDLQELQREILNNIYLDSDDTQSKRINVEFLKELASRLLDQTGNYEDTSRGF